MRVRGQPGERGPAANIVNDGYKNQNSIIIGGNNANFAIIQEKRGVSGTRYEYFSQYNTPAFV